MIKPLYPVKSGLRYSWSKLGRDVCAALAHRHPSAVLMGNGVNILLVKRDHFIGKVNFLCRCM